MSNDQDTCPPVPLVEGHYGLLRNKTITPEWFQKLELTKETLFCAGNYCYSADGCWKKDKSPHGLDIVATALTVAELQERAKALAAMEQKP